jgi:hypothetical protein
MKDDIALIIHTIIGLIFCFWDLNFNIFQIYIELHQTFSFIKIFPQNPLPS